MELKDGKDIAQDVSLLALGVIAGIAPWLADKAGFEMPKTLATVLLIGCIVLMCWAISRLGWVELFPFLRGRTISLSSALLVVLTTALVVYLFHSQSKYEYISLIDMEQVHEKSFSNTTIEVDGKYFTQCTFNNVTLIFHGRKHFGMEGNHFFGPLIFHTDDMAAEQYAGAVVSIIRISKIADPAQVGFTNGVDDIVIAKKDTATMPQQ